MKPFFLAVLILLAAFFAWWLFARDAVPAVPGSVPADNERAVEPQPAEEPKESPAAYDPVSLPALSEKTYDGRDLTVGQVLDRNEAYTRHFITYKSGALTISGIMNVPSGTPPAGGFPVLVLNHGYIDPAIYTNGRGLKREQDYLARRGYAVLHPDYRNHAQSDKDPEADIRFRLGYVEDVINLVYAVRQSGLPYLDGTRVGMLGHSMGGGVTTNILVTQPDLVRAAVLFAPVSADQADNFQRWTRSRPETADRITTFYGTPDDNAPFWRNISAIHFLDRVRAPVLLHHGTADDSVPVEWSDRLAEALRNAGKEVTYHVYPGQPHEFTIAWLTVMERTTAFFDRHVKGDS